MGLIVFAYCCGLPIMHVLIIVARIAGWLPKAYARLASLFLTLASFGLMMFSVLIFGLVTGVVENPTTVPEYPQLADFVIGGLCYTCIGVPITFMHFLAGAGNNTATPAATPAVTPAQPPSPAPPAAPTTTP